VTAAVALQFVACSPATRYVAVADGDGNRILLLDGRLSPVGSMALDSADPAGVIHGLIFSSGGEALYVWHSDGSSRVSKVRRYDGETIAQWDPPAGRLPRELALLRSAQTLLVTQYSDQDSAYIGELSFLAARDLHESTRLQVCEGRPDGLAIMRTGDRAYVRCAGRETTVAVIDLELRRVVTAEPLGTTHRFDSTDNVRHCGGGGLALSRTESLLLLPCSASGYLLYVDRMTQAVLDSVFVGSEIDQIGISPLQPYAVVTATTPPSLSFVNLRTRRVESKLPLPGPPASLVVSGDGKSALVSTGYLEGGMLLLLDMDAQLVISSVPLAGSGGIGMWPGRWSPVLNW